MFRALIPLAYVAAGITIDRPVTSMAWCGASVVYTREDETVTQFEEINQEKIVFVLTESHSIYQSNGTVWQQVEGEFTDLQVSPANSRVIYLFGKQSYRSNDCGQTFEDLNTTGLQGFKLNKMNWRWLMAYKKQECEQEDVNCKEPYNHWLHHSNDGGKTWQPSFKNVRDYAWDKVLEDPEVPDQRLVLSYQREMQRASVAFSDNFKDLINLTIEGHTFFQTPQYLFVLSPDKDAYQLFYGTSRLDRFTMRSLELPLQVLKEFSYTILDTDQGRIFIAVSHTQEEQQSTNIYVSGQNGENFQLILMNNVRSIDNGNCDFEKLLGLQQVYLANIFDMSQQQDHSKKKTVISFNGAKTWIPLIPPDKDSQGNPILCITECSLHLIGRTDSYRQALLSSDQAPGVALAIGSVGTHLDEQNLNTYLTVDGGITWKEVQKGPHLFDISDLGGLIVIAKDQDQTNELLYSTDYGESWKTRSFHDDYIKVQMIMSESSGTQRFFVVSGKTDSGEGFVLKVDFSDEFDRECSAPNDYEYWNQSCLDSSQTRYMRKKADSDCFNPKTLITKRIVEPCACTREDWICAPGYQKDPKTGECKTDAEVRRACVPGMTYQVSRGYVKQNNCQGGVDLGPIQVECPLIESTESLLLVVLGGATILICFVLMYRMIRRWVKGQPNCQTKSKQYQQMEYDDEDDDQML